MSRFTDAIESLAGHSCSSFKQRTYLSLCWWTCKLDQVIGYPYAHGVSPAVGELGTRVVVQKGRVSWKLIPIRIPSNCQQTNLPNFQPPTHHHPSIVKIVCDLGFCIPLEFIVFIWTEQSTNNPRRRSYTEFAILRYHFANPFVRSLSFFNNTHTTHRHPFIHSQFRDNSRL